MDDENCSKKKGGVHCWWVVGLSFCSDFGFTGGLVICNYVRLLLENVYINVNL